MSERKWVVEKGESFDDRSSAQYVTHSGSIDAGDDHFNIRQRVTDDAGGYAKAHTRLRLIVTAVNNHDALVDAVKHLAERLRATEAQCHIASVIQDNFKVLTDSSALLARITKG